MRIQKALPLILLVALFGCNKGPSLAGKWSVSATGIPAGAKVEVDFTDSAFTQTLDLTISGMKIHATTTGNYKIEADKIKMTTTDIKVDDKDLPPQFRDAMKTQMDKELNQTKEGTIKIEGDTATITIDKGTQTLTRIK